MECAGEFKKLCKIEGLKFHSSLSETDAAFDEHKKEWVKKFLYHYVQNSGYKCFQKEAQSGTTFFCRRICLRVLIAVSFKISNFLSIL